MIMESMGSLSFIALWTRNKKGLLQKNGGPFLLFKHERFHRLIKLISLQYHLKLIDVL